MQLSFWLYVGLFLISCSTLMLETLTTRILTITTGSHMALMTVSLAMFGLSAGAIHVLLSPQRYDSARLTRVSLAYSASVVAVCWGQLHLNQAFEPDLLGTLSSLALIAITTLPYYLSGICISSILSNGAEKIGWLYAVDLLGAGVGSWLMVALLGPLSGETTVMVAALLGALAALALARAQAPSPLLVKSGGVVLVLALLTVSNHYRPWLVVASADSKPQEFVAWNSYSRVTAKRRKVSPGWGLSDRFPGPFPEHYWLEIDGTSGTPVIAFNGQPQSVAYLTADITAMPFHLRRKARVAILGAGGGKDVLTSLVFENQDTTGVELNNQIVALLKGPLKAFSGGLVERAKFLAADGRTWMAGQRQSFDIIQLAMVDNANAFASGAITLSENGLYTLEAWQLFTQHLSERGVLSVSMGYCREEPAELLRCLSMGSTTLRSLGIEPTEAHFLVTRKPFPFQVASGQPDGVFTMMMGKRPFSQRDRTNFQWLNQQLGFESVLPGPDPNLNRLARGQSLQGCRYSLEPATDAHPFFFFSAPLSDLTSHSASLRAVIFISQLLLCALALVGLSCLLPWRLVQEGSSTAIAPPDRSLLYFLALGLGYMLVEMAMAQQFSLFLGNPTWSLCAVLSTMLLCSALGSACSPAWTRKPRLILGVLVVTLVLTQWSIPRVTEAFLSAGWQTRILVSSLMMAPAAFFMGMPFPLGMRRGAGSQRLPWCWALNGGGSLLAGPIAIATAVLWGIPQVLALGVVCYGAAWLLTPATVDSGLAENQRTGLP